MIQFEPTIVCFRIWTNWQRSILKICDKQHRGHTTDVPQRCFSLKKNPIKMLSFQRFRGWWNSVIHPEVKVHNITLHLWVNSWAKYTRLSWPRLTSPDPLPNGKAVWSYWKVPWPNKMPHIFQSYRLFFVASILEILTQELLNKTISWGAPKRCYSWSSGPESPGLVPVLDAQPCVNCP